MRFCDYFFCNSFNPLILSALYVVFRNFIILAVEYFAVFDCQGRCKSSAMKLVSIAEAQPVLAVFTLQK